MVQVKSLVHGGAAVKSCAVEEGYQIIAVGDKDVSSCTLEEVLSDECSPHGPPSLAA
jgi:C-terminal processing protease CtpA/Prc